MSYAEIAQAMERAEAGTEPRAERHEALPATGTSQEAR